MRAVLNRMLRGCLPQNSVPAAASEADGGPALPYLRLGVMASDIIGRFAEPTIRVQVRNWTVVISLSHDGRLFSAAVDEGRIVGLRCRHAGGVPEAALLSAEAAGFLPLNGEEMQWVIYRALPDGWLLVLRQIGRVPGEALGVELAVEPASDRGRRCGAF